MRLAYPRALCAYPRALFAHPKHLFAHPPPLCPKLLVTIFLVVQEYWVVDKEDKGEKD